MVFYYRSTAETFHGSPESDPPVRMCVSFIKNVSPRETGKGAGEAGWGEEESSTVFWRVAHLSHGTLECHKIYY